MSDPELVTSPVTPRLSVRCTIFFQKATVWSLNEWFLTVHRIATCCIESDAILKSIAATHMSVHHALLFWAMSLYVTRWSVVWNLFSESCLVGVLVLMESDVKPIVHHGGEQLVMLWERTDRSVIFLFRWVSFFVDHRDHTFFP